LLIWLPTKEGRAVNSDLFNIYTDPFILYGFLASIPIFVALYKAFRLLGYIGKDKAFSSISVKALRSIKHYAIFWGVLMAIAGFFIMLFHNKNDDPAGFLALCVITVFISLILAAAASVLERILQKGMDLTSLNNPPKPV